MVVEKQAMLLNKYDREETLYSRKVNLSKKMFACPSCCLSNEIKTKL